MTTIILIIIFGIPMLISLIMALKSKDCKEFDSGQSNMAKIIF